METDLKMYIFINTSLGISHGKMISQACHLVGIMTDEVVRMSYEVFPTPLECILYEKWKTNCTLIILGANAAQFEKLSKVKGVRHFFDTGKTTQVESGTLTVLGFFPGANFMESGSDKKIDLTEFKLLS
jgi:peptidyl-tRNA hydrolase